MADTEGCLTDARERCTRLLLPPLPAEPELEEEVEAAPARRMYELVVGLEGGSDDDAVVNTGGCTGA